MDELERCVLVKPEIFVYKIPPRQSARGYRAADWNLAAPDWTGRLRCMVKGNLMTMKLEDRGSGELFAACPVEQFPGMSVEPVTDSSRYFVICIKDDTSRKAYIGIGFTDRSDSFDLNVALQDHFKQIKKEEQFIKDEVSGSEPSKPILDLAFKEGQTIRVNLNLAVTSKKEKSATKSDGFILPPPPGATSVSAMKPPPPPSSAISPVVTPTGAPSNSISDLLDLDLLNIGSTGAPAPKPLSPDSGDPWGDFESAPSDSTMKSGSWEQF